MSEANVRKRFTNIHVTDLLRYRLPAAGFVSILHRISGAMMFVLLPFILYLFDLSLTSEISFAYLAGFASHWFVKLMILALSWAYLHHFCAGVRHLVMDLHIGLSKESAGKSARSVLLVSVPLAVLVAFKLFGGF